MKDKTLAKVLFVLRDVYTRGHQQYITASKANDVDGITESQAIMLTAEEVARELRIVLFTEAEKQQMTQERKRL